MPIHILALFNHKYGGPFVKLQPQSVLRWMHMVQSAYRERWEETFLYVEVDGIEKPLACLAKEDFPTFRIYLNFFQELC